MCKCVFLMLCFGLNTGISIRHMQITQSFVKFEELISKASWENIQDNLRSSPNKAHTLKQTMEKERQQMHSTDRHEDTTQAWWYMIYDSFTLWQVIKNGRKGNGRGFCLCVCVWAFVVVLSQTGFLVEKFRLLPYHVETRTAFQHAEQPTHSFIWINLTQRGSLPANSALRALSVFLSLRSTLCSWPKHKNVFTLH